MVGFEKEVCALLSLPSIPKKEWDKTSSFDKGVALITAISGRQEYAVASFDAEKNDKPVIKKVFGFEPFAEINRIFVVPSYMDTDIDNADLDDASKKKAKEIIKEAQEIETEGVEEETPLMKDIKANPYLFDFIHNDEEAIAYIKAYNKKNRINGRLPQNHEAITARLAVIYSEVNKRS